MANPPTEAPNENTGHDDPQDGSQPGVLGDQSQAQDLGQPGDPSARITEEEVQDAFKDGDKG